MKARATMLTIGLAAVLCGGCHDGEGGGLLDPTFNQIDGAYAAVVTSETGPLLNDRLNEGDTLRVEIDERGELRLGELGDPIQLSETENDTFVGSTTADGIVYEATVRRQGAAVGDVADIDLELLVHEEGAVAGEPIAFEVMAAPDLQSLAGIVRVTVVAVDAGDSDDGDETPQSFAFDAALSDHGLLVWPSLTGGIQLIRESDTTLIGRVTGLQVDDAATPPRRLVVAINHAGGVLLNGTARTLVDADEDGAFEVVAEDLTLALTPRAQFAPLAGTFGLTQVPRPTPTGVFASGFGDSTIVIDRFGNAVLQRAGIGSPIPLTLGFDGTSFVGFAPRSPFLDPGFERFSFARSPIGGFAGTGRVDAFDGFGANQGNAGFAMTGIP